MVMGPGRESAISLPVSMASSPKTDPTAPPAGTSFLELLKAEEAAGQDPNRSGKTKGSNAGNTRAAVAHQPPPIAREFRVLFGADGENDFDAASKVSLGTETVEDGAEIVKENKEFGGTENVAPRLQAFLEVRDDAPAAAKSLHIVENDAEFESLGKAVLAAARPNRRRGVTARLNEPTSRQTSRTAGSLPPSLLLIINQNPHLLPIVQDRTLPPLSLEELAARRPSPPSGISVEDNLGLRDLYFAINGQKYRPLSMDEFAANAGLSSSVPPSLIKAILKHSTLRLDRPQSPEDLSWLRSDEVRVQAKDIFALSDLSFALNGSYAPAHSDTERQGAGYRHVERLDRSTGEVTMSDGTLIPLPSEDAELLGRMLDHPDHVVPSWLGRNLPSTAQIRRLGEWLGIRISDVSLEESPIPGRLALESGVHSIGDVSLRFEPAFRVVTNIATGQQIIGVSYDSFECLYAQGGNQVSFEDLEAYLYGNPKPGEPKTAAARRRTNVSHRIQNIRELGVQVDNVRGEGFGLPV